MGDKRATAVGFAMYLCACSLSSVAFATTGDVSFMTFNSPAYLASERVALLNSIRTESTWRNTDVVCLQELRASDDLAQTSAALREQGFTYQHSFMNYFNLTARPACSDLNALNSFVACAQKAVICQSPTVRTAGIRHIATCLFFSCLTETERLPQPCFECLSNPRFTPEVTAAVARCTSSSSPETSYAPTYGLLLASRKALSNMEAVPFLPDRPAISTFGYLKADVDGVGSVYCTHMTPNLTTSPILSNISLAEGGFDTQQEANLNETRRLIEQLQSTGGILLGDLNNGPDVPSAGIFTSFSSNFPEWAARGIQSAMLLLNQRECTLCGRTNPRATAEDDEIVDHVMLTERYRNSVIEGDVLFRENLTGQSFPLSDHYAVRVVINTGNEHQVQLSRWERRFASWEAAYQRWQTGSCRP